jgi:hypothetical protein
MTQAVRFQPSVADVHVKGDVTMIGLDEGEDVGNGCLFK